MKKQLLIFTCFLTVMALSAFCIYQAYLSLNFSEENHIQSRNNGETEKDKDKTEKEAKKTLPPAPLTDKPKNNREFARVLGSEKRNEYLIKIIEERQKYCYGALLKIRQLKLSELAPKLHEIYQKEVSKDKKNPYYQTKLKETLLALDYEIEKNSKISERKENKVSKK